MPPVAAWENSVRAGVAVNLTGLTLVNRKFNNYFLPLREKPAFSCFCVIILCDLPAFRGDGLSPVLARAAAVVGDDAAVSCRLWALCRQYAAHQLETQSVIGIV